MIAIPTLCPSCGSHLTTVNEQLFCVNKSCGSKMLKQIEFFSKTLKIKGLGEKTIEKLGLETISDIYELQEQDYIEALGEKLGTKLYIEVQQSKLSPLELLLPAFSIALIGNSASSKVCSVVKHIDEINEQTCKQAGLGPVATSNILKWLSTDFVTLKSLPFTFSSSNITRTAHRGTVCITGKLSSFSSREKAKEHLVSLGFKVVDSVTKSTDYLVDEEGKTSSKSEKALALKIPILTIKDLERIIND